MRIALIDGMRAKAAAMAAVLALVGCQPSGVGTIGPDMDGPEAADATGGGRMSDANPPAASTAPAAETTSAEADR